MQHATIVSQGNLQFQSNLYESNNPTRRWIHQVRRNWIFEKIDFYSDECRSVLEVGTGCGIYTEKLSEHYPEVTTIDINPAFVDAVTTNNPSVISFVADIEKFRSPEIYDLVLMSEVLEHVADTRMALRSVHLHLSTNGYFILTTPNKFSTTEIVGRLLKIKLFAKFARTIYGEPVDELGHINLRTRSELIREIHAEGFEIIERTDRSFYLPVIAELGGELGRQILESISRMIAKSDFLSNLLWTQCYILKKK